MTGGYVILKDDFSRVVMNGVVSNLNTVNYNGAYEYFKSLPNKQLQASVKDIINSQGYPISGHITANLGEANGEFGPMYVMSLIFSGKVYQLIILEAQPNTVQIMQ